GQAEITIPIRAIPARNGLSPSLAFTYRSGDRHGVLGRGFVLDGVSRITRCARTPATDGYTRRVQYDEGDAYCLDGQRLLEHHKHGAYTDFRTERESFLLIRAYFGGNRDDGPNHWRVRAPDGEVRWYGTASENARNPLSDETVLAEWMIARTEDSFGNAMRFVWSEDPRWPDVRGPRGAIGERTLRYIEYASHTSGLAADRRIDFTYGDHNAPIAGFAAGLAWQHTARLNELTTVLGSKPVRQYRLGYASDTGRNQLVSAMECVVADPEVGTTLDKGMVCLPATHFEWSNEVGGATFETESVSLSSVAEYDGALPTPAYGVPLDANGDGVTDYAYLSLGRLYLRLADPTLPTPLGPGGLTLTTSISDLRSMTDRLTAHDWNQDGRDDLIYLAPNADVPKAEVRVLLSEGDDFTEVATGLEYLGAELHNDIFSGDPPGGSFGVQPLWVPQTHGVSRGPHPTSQQSLWRFGDFNGDGLIDVLACELEVYKDCHQTRMNGFDSTVCTQGEWSFAPGTSDSSGPGFGPKEMTGVQTGCGFFRSATGAGWPTADLTGDGVLDVLIPDADAYYALTYRHDSESFELATLLGNASGAADLNTRRFVDPRLSDVNGDGVTDLIVKWDTEDTYAAVENIGEGRPQAQWRTSVFIGQGDGTFQSGAMRYPDLWSFDHREVGFRFSRCNGGGIGNPCNERYQHLFSPVYPIDEDGDGTLELLSFAYVEGAQYESNVGAGLGWPDRTPFVFRSADPFYAYVDVANDASAPTLPTPLRDDDEEGRTLRQTRMIPGDFNGDGHRDLLQTSVLLDDDKPGGAELHLNRSARFRRIVGVVYGSGSRQEVTYSMTSDPAVYTPGPTSDHLPCRYPQRCDARPRQVVSAMTYAANSDEPRRFVYEYADSRSDILGRGWLGFGRRVETEELTGAVVRHDYGHDVIDEATGIYPFAGRATKRITVLVGDTSHPFDE
ncbi:MAG: SpvB/TcaC N-terminal domain-containing protein, partial [Myxococcota bacterium]